MVRPSVPAMQTSYKYTMATKPVSSSTSSFAQLVNGGVSMSKDTARATQTVDLTQPSSFSSQWIGNQDGSSQSNGNSENGKKKKKEPKKKKAKVDATTAKKKEDKAKKSLQEKSRFIDTFLTQTKTLLPLHEYTEFCSCLKRFKSKTDSLEVLAQGMYSLFSSSPERRVLLNRFPNLLPTKSQRKFIDMVGELATK